MKLIVIPGRIEKIQRRNKRTCPRQKDLNQKNLSFP